MLKKRFSKLNDAFDADHVNFWSQLSRLNNLMVIVNISMFFLTGMVLLDVLDRRIHRDLLSGGQSDLLGQAWPRITGDQIGHGEFLENPAFISTLR
ncbi:MAG: hypothetical protein R6V60_03745 [Desulfobacterales bacterium]